MTSLLETIPVRQPQYPVAQKPANNTQAFKAQDKKHETKVKVATLTGSILTTAAYIFALAKSAQKGNFKAKDLLNVDFHNMFKVMGLATSAVIGGMTGGLLTDKENRKAKLQEGIHQFFGNIITPITIVGIACNAIEKRNFSKTKEILLSGLTAITGVAVGVTSGNWFASKVNKAIFKEDDGRHVSIKDFSIHVDDLLTVAALTPIGRSIQSFISVALPAIFQICGYEAGTHTEHEKHKHKHADKA